jgi:hypothetical protein
MTIQYIYVFVDVRPSSVLFQKFQKAFCDPRPRSYQIMSAAQRLALINTIRIRARIIN